MQDNFSIIWLAIRLRGHRSSMGVSLRRFPCGDEEMILKLNVGWKEVTSMEMGGLG